LGFDLTSRARQKNTPIINRKYSSGMNEDQCMASPLNV
jgi:hypothetical protein